MIPYPKHYKSPEQIVNLLKTRGLNIDDESLAIETIKNIGYYRFSAYLYPFLALPKENQLFKSGSDFEYALNIYNFDHELRILIFEEIAKIEVAIKSAMANIMAKESGNIFWTTDAEMFANIECYKKTISIIDNEMRHTKEEFIEHFKRKYSYLCPFIIFMSSINELQKLRESEDHIEFKEAKRNYPLGRLLKFEGIPLMRTGESLREMSDAEVFRILSEQEPDFSGTDPYQVCLTFKAPILDDGFVRFIRHEQQNRDDNRKLNVFELIVLYKVCMRDFTEIDTALADKLYNEGLLVFEKGYYRLPDSYKSALSEKLKGYNLKHLQMVSECFKTDTFITRAMLKEIFADILSERQVKTFIAKMEASKFIERRGGGKYVQYSKTPDFPSFK